MPKVRDRFVFDPKKVRMLDRDQSRTIARETYPERDFDDEQIESLRHLINGQLKFVIPPDTEWTDIDDVREAVESLRNKLHNGNVSLLTRLGYFAGDPKSQIESDDLERRIAATLLILTQSVKEVSGWLDNDKACKLMRRSFEPLLGFESLTGYLLPHLFQIFFLRRFTVSPTSPGVKFVVAVLREAGIRSITEVDDFDTIYEQIRKSRTRQLKPPKTNRPVR